MGLMREALMAGIRPAIVPAMMMVRVALMHTSSPTVGSTNIVALNMPESITMWPMVASIYRLVSMPQSMPM